MQRRRAAALRSGGAAPIFAALGDPMRLRIVGRLGAGGPRSTASLTAGTEISRQAVAKHLRALEDAGLVRGERVGRDRIWELRTSRLLDVRRYLEEIAAQWDDALARLRLHVEGKGRKGS